MTSPLHEQDSSLISLPGFKATSGFFERMPLFRDVRRELLTKLARLATT